MRKRESAFKGKAVSGFAILFMILSGCSDDDSVTDATNEQRASSERAASDGEYSRENIWKSDIYVEDGSAEEALRALTSYIEESKMLGFIRVETSAVGEDRSARRRAEEILESRGIFEGLDAERRRAIILETGPTELGCLLNALGSSAKLVSQTSIQSSAVELTADAVGTHRKSGAYAKDTAQRSQNSSDIQTQAGISLEDLDITTSSSQSLVPDSSGVLWKEFTSEIGINLDGGSTQVRYLRYSMTSDSVKNTESASAVDPVRVNDFDEVTGEARTRAVNGDIACVLSLRGGS